MKLRIAMVGACPYPVPQGSQVFMSNTAQCLRDIGHEVHLVVYGYGVGADHSGLRIHRAARVPFARKTSAGPSFAKPLQDLTLTARLRRVIRRHHIQVVCAHNYEALLASLVVGKRPLLYFAHNAMSDELPYYFRGAHWAGRLGRWLDRTFPRRADRVLVPHQRLAGHLIVRGCDHRNVALVPPPVDASRFTPCKTAPGVPPILYAGNLDAYQNLGLLFAAMEQVRKVRPDARLMVATAEDVFLPEAELVPVRGFDALPRLLAQDSVYAVPRVSWSGYPIKLLNAMAAGKAIVACHSAAYPLSHEHNGLIVPDHDVDAFAQALLRLMEDAKLRAELGRNARQTILDFHRPEQVGEQLESILVELTGAL